MFGFGMLAVFVFYLALDLRNGVRVCVTVCRVSECDPSRESVE